MKQVRNLAEFYKRPLADFFLEKIPKEFRLPDFRNLNLDESNYDDLEPVIRTILTKKSDATNFGGSEKRNSEAFLLLLEQLSLDKTLQNLRKV